LDQALELVWVHLFQLLQLVLQLGQALELVWVYLFQLLQSVLRLGQALELVWVQMWAYPFQIFQILLWVCLRHPSQLQHLILKGLWVVFELSLAQAQVQLLSTDN
jgi:hypothetical protein